jgi:hypothetical protein
MRLFRYGPLQFGDQTVYDPNRRVEAFLEASRKRLEAIREQIELLDREITVAAAEQIARDARRR